MTQLDALRQELNSLDDSIVALLNRRMELALEIAGLKDALAMPLTDHAREGEIMTRLESCAVEPALKANIRAIWKPIMQSAKALRQTGA